LRPGDKNYERIDAHHVRLPKGMSVEEALEIYRSDPDTTSEARRWQISLKSTGQATLVFRFCRLFTE